MGPATFPAMLQTVALPDDRELSGELARPNKEVRPIRGKKFAVAIPTCALANRNCCSAVKMSGRRSSNAEGKPTGISGGTICSRSLAVCGIGLGLLPNNTLI